MTAPTSSSKRRFQELVTLVLGVATGKPVEVVKSRVKGIEGWSIVSRAVASQSFSAALSEAQLTALREGSKYSAAIVPRRDKAVGDAFVMMPLEDFARLLGERAEDD